MSYFKMRLNLFDEGATAEAAVATQDAKQSVVYGKAADGASDVHQNDGESDANPIVDRKAEFEKLIKGDYKAEYESRLRENLDRRLKSAKAAEDNYKKLSPVLQILGQKYGVSAEDPEALSKAIEEDDSYYEQEAMEKGMAVADLKEMKRLQRENADFRKNMEETQRRENADKIYKEWIDQSEKLKQKYPAFDLQEELKNTEFNRLMRVPGMDIETAFTVVHKDELFSSALQYATQKTEEKIVNNIRARGMRPAENGTIGSATAVRKADPSQLSHENLVDIRERVRRGEKIVF